MSEYSRDAKTNELRVSSGSTKSRGFARLSLFALAASALMAAVAASGCVVDDPEEDEESTELADLADEPDMKACAQLCTCDTCVSGSDEVAGSPAKHPSTMRATRSPGRGAAR